MPGPLRVFISSTMRDLANERDAVVTRLRDFNFEPVNAEGILTDGGGVWSRIQMEIASSDIFVLILGESYGWIPSSGPRSERGLSVTELEFEQARAQGIPILVFTKRLRLEDTTDADDARRRDGFRQRVQDWDGGYLRTEFDLASDLAAKVGRAVVGMISDRFRAAAVDQRRGRSLEHTAVPARPLSAVELPASLVDAVARRRAVLFLGAGASLQAGMPSAAAFIDAMVERLRTVDPAYEPLMSGTTFNAVATDFKSVLGEGELWDLARLLVDPAYVPGPTDAHRIAVELFDTLLTTNYDELLERALGGRRAQVIHKELLSGEQGDLRRIIKLHGSIADPAGLVLTETDLANLEDDRPRLWAELKDVLRGRPLLSIGSSLRDPSVIRLLEACRPELSGWGVLFHVSTAEQRRLEHWGLQAIEGDANSVMAALQRAVNARRSS